jgi:hypothetical protein
MQEMHKEFLVLLAYFFLQNRKVDKALVLFRFLHSRFPDDRHVLKSLSYASILTGAHERGLRLANQFLKDASDKEDVKLGCLLQGKSLWGLGRKEEARQAVSRYLRVKGNPDETEPR